LDEVISLKSYNLYALELYFKERNRINFFKHEGQVYAKVGNFVFALPFPFGIYELVETFYQESYSTFDMKNGNVVDIGAFIGDSAVYFASKGAGQVIAFEPAKNLFGLAIQNIRLNDLDEVVYIRNEAVGVDYGEETFYYLKSHPGGSSILPRKKDFICYKVKVIPLSSVIAELGHVDLLKIDCEGMENKILLKAYKDESLKDVTNMIIEAHGFQRLKNTLEILRNASFKFVNLKNLRNDLCLIYATRT